ncbi:uncharacterized protein LOC142981079 [Anticarsia gemmatalis]|uniref:uncharacterized protein LOC142981079 n=1 Tax=Anticarsia gemmatalis TaxID=129554 RepID=UPI003F75E6EC
MYSNMCVKIVLSLALVACINAHVLKYHQLQPIEVLTVEDAVKNKDADLQSISLQKMDIDEVEDNGVLTPEELLRDLNEPRGLSSVVGPSFEDRNGIRVGTCPLGYVRIGGICHPEDY